MKNKGFHIKKNEHNCQEKDQCAVERKKCVLNFFNEVEI